MKFVTEWERVDGACPRCEAEGSLLALVTRAAGARMNDGSHIEGERCTACGWLLEYCQLDVEQEQPEAFRMQPVKGIKVA